MECVDELIKVNVQACGRSQLSTVIFLTSLIGATEIHDLSLWADFLDRKQVP